MKKKHPGNLEQETATLLKILQIGTDQIKTGRVQPAASVIARLKERPSARSMDSGSEPEHL